MTCGKQPISSINLSSFKLCFTVQDFKFHMWCFARFGTICTILKMWKTHEGVLFLVKLEALACKSNTPSWVFFTFFKLFKWYQIALRITSSMHDALKLWFWKNFESQKTSHNQRISSLTVEVKIQQLPWETLNLKVPSEYTVASRVKVIVFKRYGRPKNVPKIEKLYTFQWSW